VLELAADYREAAPGNGSRCLPTSTLRSSRPKGGGSTTSTKQGAVATGEAAWFGRNNSHDHQPPEDRVRRFCYNIRTPRPEGYSNGDHALPHRYPLSTCTPNIRECELGLAHRLALEARVLDGRAIGGQRVQPSAGFPDMYPGT
jgi:hypothetical protein